MSTEEILRRLVNRLDHEDPSTSVQSYCASVLKKVADPLSGNGSLSRKRDRSLGFTIGAGRPTQYVSKNGGSPESVLQRVYRHARALDAFLEDLPNAAQHREAVLRLVAKRSGFVIRPASDAELDIHQAIALRDHMGGSTNSVSRLQ